MRVLRGSAPTLSVTFLDGEDPVDVGPVSVSVTNDRGVEVGTGTATADPANVGRYTFRLAPATTAQVDLLTVTWTGTETRVTEAEVVADYLASIADLRQLKDLDSEYVSADDLAQARDYAEDLFRDVTGVSWTGRYARTRSDVIGGQAMVPDLYPRAILWATQDGEEADTSGWDLDDSGVIDGPDGRRVEVAYEHGKQRVPADLRGAFLKFVRHLVLDDSSDLVTRANTLSTDHGTFSINQAGKDRPTGLPDVDVVLRAHDETRQAFA